MRIGEAADQADINPKTIRYYESIGLIGEADRTAGGYRDYAAADVERLTFIKSASGGLSLDEIGEVLAFRARGEQPCSYNLGGVRRRTDEIDRQIRELLQLREDLIDLAARAEQTDNHSSSRYCRLLEGSGKTGAAHPPSTRSHDAR